MHDAALREVQIGEMAVRVRQFELDRAGRLGPATPDLGKRIFETMREVDARPMLRTGDRIANGLAVELGNAVDPQPAAARCRITPRLPTCRCANCA